MLSGYQLTVSSDEVVTDTTTVWGGLRGGAFPRLKVWATMFNRFAVNPTAPRPYSLLQCIAPPCLNAYLSLVATYGFTIFAGSTTRSNSASVTKPSFKAAAFNVRSLSVA